MLKAMFEPSLFLAVLLAAPAAGAPPRKKGGSIELGMSRAQVRKALDGMGGGTLEAGPADACGTSDVVRFKANHVYARGRLRFDKKAGEGCGKTVRTDKAYDIDLEFVPGLDGKGIVDQHLKGLGKPAKEERAGGVATYEWRKEKFTVLLQVNLEDGTALRRAIRDRELEGK